MQGSAGPSSALDNLNNSDILIPHDHTFTVFQKSGDTCNVVIDYHGIDTQILFSRMPRRGRFTMCSFHSRGLCSASLPKCITVRESCFQHLPLESYLVLLFSTFASFISQDCGSLAVTSTTILFRRIANRKKQPYPTAARG
jgi:hypothetical protein